MYIQSVHFNLKWYAFESYKCEQAEPTNPGFKSQSHYLRQRRTDTRVSEGSKKMYRSTIYVITVGKTIPLTVEEVVHW